MKLRAEDVRADLAADGRVEAAGCAPEVVFAGVSTDSRAAVEGRLFVALAGERFDAHDYVPDVLARGARGVVVRRGALAGLPAGDYARYGVEDPLRALQAIARGSLRRQRPLVVAITGSNGKTTTKDLTVAALGAGGGRVHGTQGNLNNHIGVPLTVLARTGDEEFLVAECGANDFGELDLLSRLLEPDVVVITNIGRAHLERFGSEDGVRRAKSELLAALRPAGRAILNADDASFDALAARAGRDRVTSFGFAPAADFRIESAAPLDAARQLLVVRGVQITLARPGRGNARNAAAALAVAGTLGRDLAAAAAALERCSYTGGRSDWQRLGDVDVLDDTYNANPDSMAQALELLVLRPGRRLAVLGDMLELGPEADRLHAVLGRQVAAAGIEHFLALGPHMAHAVQSAGAAGMGDRARHFATHADLVAALRALLRPGDGVLVKGSRGSRMERVVAALADAAGVT
jgi:UDP-N-acetylmuramoyl-tripeptide--D-alanyl-D-alanine ligase